MPKKLGIGSGLYGKKSPVSTSYPDYRIGVAFGAALVFIPPVAAVTFNIVLWVKQDLTLCLQHV
jgi:hypothetical protein